MTQEIYEFLFEAMQWLIFCPLLATTFHIALFGLLETIGYEFHPEVRKFKCWIYIVLFVFGLAVLLHVFAA